MRHCGTRPILGIAVLLGLWSGSPAHAQGTNALAIKTVHGKLERIDVARSGVVVVSDEGKRMAWRFDKAVIAQLEGFKPGEPVVVIYRQKGPDKAVTAIGFPGAAATPVYVNTTGEPVDLVSGPMVNGTCHQASDAPPNRTTIPVGGRTETTDACWCCAPAGRSCVPANKTGLGQAFLSRCYE